MLKYIKYIIKSILTIIFGLYSSFISYKQEIALTFDDGPHPVFTEMILELLKKHNVKATFFVVGNKVKKYSNLYNKIISHEHCIGNHSYSHNLPSHSTITVFFKQLNKTQQLIYNPCKFFRPPQGRINFFKILLLKLLRYKIIVWTFHVQDFENKNMREYLEQLNNKKKPGSIILLHDNVYDGDTVTVANRNELIKALDIFLKENVDKYNFVTLKQVHKKLCKQLWIQT